jgi:ferredoxin
MRKAGFLAVAENLGIVCADFENGTLVTNKNGMSHKLFVIANGVLAASGVVSVPKLKTHGLTRITGAVKNQFGCVPGTYKGQYHARAPNVHDFSRLLADITAFVKPRLYVMDAVMAMEGNGPQNGDPRRLGLLMLSSDPVALDAIACKIIGLNPGFVPTCAAGEEAGLGTWRIDRITCVGDDIADFATPDFKVTRLAAVSIPDNPATRTLRNLLVTRPAIHAAACTRCGNCISACPVEPRALDWGRLGKARPPVYKYNKCIRCFCCQEICPAGAVRIKTPLLGRLMPVAAYLSLWISNIRAKRIK